MVFKDLLLFFDDSSLSSCPLDDGVELSLSFFVKRWTKSSPVLIPLFLVVSLSVMLSGRCFFAGVICKPKGTLFWPSLGSETKLEDALGVRVNILSLANERRGLRDRSERASALEVSLLSLEVSNGVEANTTEELASSRRRFC
jgi:hypothetical protein